MDRVIVYPGQIVTELHLLLTNRNAMCAVGDLALTTFGANTLVNGLALSPTSPASMTINVGPGSIYSVEEVDSVPYSSVGTDTTQNTVKQGLNLSATPFTLTAPSSGNTTAYLIEAKWAENDTGSAVLPYYNSVPPYTEWAGPNNTGAAQPQYRTSSVSLQIKSSTYTTGSTPTIPAVDPGWTGIYLVTVNGGQTSITSGDLIGCQYPGAPFPPQQMQSTRLRAMGPIVVPIATYGSDSWVQPTSLTPFATIAHALSYLQNDVDFNGQQGTILLGSGTFAGGVVNGLCLGQVGALVIQGNGSSNTTITNLTGETLIIESGAQVEIQELSIGSTAGDSIYINGGASCTNGADLKFLAAGNAQIRSNIGAVWFTGADYTVSGGAVSHMTSTGGGNIYSVGHTVTLSGTPNFTGAVADAAFGIITAVDMTYVGSATGTQYNISQNGVLNTGGALSSFPGTSSSGTTSSGGQAI